MSESIVVAVSQEEYNSLKKKADLYDEIAEGVSKFYPDEDEDADDKEYDLGDIGEFVARKLGWL